MLFTEKCANTLNFTVFVAPKCYAYGIVAQIFLRHAARYLTTMQE
ncbi:hypothetical protein HCH_02585 [Hahella chejuensis KCTC 2396]|uniref:Uncharacterized protein n=1 Tax=Hahella chejuensis (strain KCTC 2396) TaxID=349521 RepID=Q2SIZ6_HAHCH|nr:hypothetical protein HCH_02585 [Hahella chejuensis KCTC 2396]